MRLVILTVGVTHSGKTTFAKMLEKHLPHSIVIDQDNHADFVNTHYKSLLPTEGPNTLKYAVTRTIMEYAVQHTDRHLILCNSYRERTHRLNLLEHFRHNGFTSVVVYFDLPESILRDRVVSSGRSTSIFRKAGSFDGLLSRQLAETHEVPTESESDYLFIIRDSSEVLPVIQNIVKMV